MNSISLKQILVVIVATGIALYLLERAKPPSGQYSDATRHGACAQVGARNHSGGEPYDPSGLCLGGQKRDYYAGRDLPDEGR
jgi:hypothetical protein